MGHQYWGPFSQKCFKNYLLQNDGLNKSFNSILLAFVIGNIVRIFGRELDFQLVSLFLTRGLSPKPQADIFVSKGIRIARWSPKKDMEKLKDAHKIVQEIVPEIVPEFKNTLMGYYQDW